MKLDHTTSYWTGEQSGFLVPTATPRDLGGVRLRPFGGDRDVVADAGTAVSDATRGPSPSAPPIT